MRLSKLAADVPDLEMVKPSPEAGTNDLRHIRCQQVCRVSTGLMEERVVSGGDRPSWIGIRCRLRSGTAENLDSVENRLGRKTQAACFRRL